jgi:hypothetical protein
MSLFLITTKPKLDHKTFDPHNIPKGQALDVWLGDNFLFIGPLANDLSDVLALVSAFDEDRYWGTIETAEAPVAEPSAA